MVPEPTSVLCWLAFSRRGVAAAMACGSFFAAGRYAPAVEALDGREGVWAHCNRALANLELELFRACVRECDAALRLEPICLRAYHLRALALIRMGKGKEARTSIMEALAAGEDGQGDMWVYRDLSALLSTLDDDGKGPAPSGPAASAASERLTLPVPPQAVASAQGRAPPPPPDNRGKERAADDALESVLSGCGVPVEVLDRVRESLCFASGVPAIDNGIALGYLKVNTGKYSEALDLFQILLDKQPGLIAARLGRGSAFALMGRFEEGVQEFSEAIRIDPSVADSWKRRGQTRSALGDMEGALSDLCKAIELDPSDVDGHQQRGLTLHKMRDFRRALTDLRKVVDAHQAEGGGQQQQAKVVWNFVGLCEANLGHVEEALRAYDRAMSLDPTFKEASLNKAQLLRDMGRGEDAIKGFEATLRLDKAYVQAYQMKGMCHYGVGQMREAAKVLSSGLMYDPMDKGCRHWLALAHQALGAFREAAQCYDHVLRLVPDHTYHVAWYHRELNAYWWSRLDCAWASFNPDRELDPQLKEGWAKGYHPWELKAYKPLPAPTHIPDLSEEAKQQGEEGGAAELCFLVDMTRPMGRWIQLNRCPGFLSNARQHRMCGLAALEVAQTVRAHWDSLQEGGLGVTVSDQQASSGPRPGGAVGVHPFGWRDLFDIAVRWRQVSEPNDPVWWIDRLVPESFADGFGLQTPLVNGQLKVIRYYSYFERAFALMRSLIASQVPGLSEADKRLIEGGVQDLDGLYGLVKHDFWVVSPCKSRAVPGRVMEGTRLTLVASTPDGYEFTIRTPGTPSRWREYDEELRSLWGQLTEAYVQGEEDVDAISDLILSIFYYWVNFGPLSRGSAACGYVVVYGLFLAMGMRLSTGVAEGVQMDWEAILSPDPEAFLESVRPWLYPAREAFSLGDDWPVVAEAIDTPRRAVQALNLP